MTEKYMVQGNEYISDYFPPIAVVDSSGLIVWSNRDNEGTPRLAINSNLTDIIADFSLHDLIDKGQGIYSFEDDTRYCISAHLLKNQDVVLVFNDPSYIDKINQRMEHYIEDYNTLNMLLDRTYQGIIYIDENGIVRFVNDSFAYYIHMSKAELIGKQFKDFRIDADLLKVIKTQKPDLLTFYPKPRKLIASRHPVFRNGRIAGAIGEYVSVDPKDVDEKVFGKEYIDLISKLQTRDIMFNVSQTLIELNSYKDEFRRQHTSHSGIDKIIGNSFQIRELKEKVLRIANSPSSVLISGESGTGKELLAQAIHFHGSRSSRPFVKINCAAIPENLLEAELFGYTDGAFTGARKGGKMGKFELADKGTIFLDEIGDMPLSMQTKLLRVLQSRDIERIGGDHAIPIDVKIISATNKDLCILIEEGLFREDLYYRLNVIKFCLPPLRERKEDIPEIVNYTIGQLNTRLSSSITSISAAALKLLINYDWPGNIRELVNVLEAAMNFCRSYVIETEDLPNFLNSNSDARKNSTLAGKKDKLEKEQILSALKQCNGNLKAAAALLNLSKSTLYRKMKKHDLL